MELGNCSLVVYHCHPSTYCMKKVSLIFTWGAGDEAVALRYRKVCLPNIEKWLEIIMRLSKN